MNGETYGLDLSVPFQEGLRKASYSSVHSSPTSGSSAIDLEVPPVGTVQLLWTPTTSEPERSPVPVTATQRDASSGRTSPGNALSPRRRGLSWPMQAVGLDSRSVLGGSLVLDVPGSYGYPAGVPAGGYAPRTIPSRAQRVHESEVTAELFRYRVVKRAMDVSLIVLSLPVLLPVIALLAVLVRLTSNGPAFFSHRRICRGGAYFPMWKFRTMCVNAAEVLEQYLAAHPEAQAEWKQNHKLQHDPRVTRLGRFMRRTSLDELPQLWNVLTGTMSLVGPRPIVTAEIEKYGDCFPCYTSVKPGITGLWQVSGRSTLSYEARVKLDCEYASRWSLRRDLRILLATFRSVLGKDGAY